MSTDNSINAMTRFVARRGPPRVVYNDNGTNFRGAEQDVVKVLKAWNQEKSKVNSSEVIHWHFNTLAASRHGGVWERLIRSVTRILRSMIGGRLLDDETLVTLLTEVEKIMNSRPIARVSNDVNDLEALTPNHILFLDSNSNEAPVKVLANEFWSRWIKEY